MKKIITFFATVLITASAWAEQLYYTDYPDCYEDCSKKCQDETNCKPECLKKNDIIYVCPKALTNSYINLSCTQFGHDTYPLYQCAQQPVCYGYKTKQGEDKSGRYEEQYFCSDVQSCRYVWDGIPEGVFVCQFDIEADCHLPEEDKCQSTASKHIYTKCNNGYYLDNAVCEPCGNYEYNGKTIKLTSDGTGHTIQSCYVDPDKEYTDERGTYKIRGEKEGNNCNLID